MSRDSFLTLIENPLCPLWPFSEDELHPPKHLHIAVLDSSFNPPTRGHLGVASLKTLPPSSSTHHSSLDNPLSDQSPSTDKFDATLLLFSNLNADKGDSSRDLDFTERAIMIMPLALELEETNGIPTTVGSLDEPTFVGKSRALQASLAKAFRAQGLDEIKVNLTFMVGTDTVTRFFEPRYYESIPGGMNGALDGFFNVDGSTLIAARRSGQEEAERELLQRADVKPWVEAGKVRIYGTGKEDWAEMSSTKVRQAVKEKDWDTIRRTTLPAISNYILRKDLYK